MITNTIVFIHGLFQNPDSWAQWKRFFESAGYTCHAPAYPYHDGEPSALRANPDPALGQLTFGQVIDHLEMFLSTLPEPPILVGHSMGGLATQTLVNRGLAAAGICIDTAPPRGIVSFKWSFVRANTPTVNPFRGNSVCLPSVKWFHYAFCNTMTMEETQREYDRYVVPESRNIPRSTLGRDGAIDFRAPHAPLLFIAGDADNIIPRSLNWKNYKAYKHAGSRRDFQSFPGRGHYICGQEGWEEVAEYIQNWISSLD